MDKKVAVITGAGSGLGASFAKKYAALGWHVCLLGRTKDKLLQVTKACENKASIYTLDISIKKDVSLVFDSIKEEHGHIDLLINNAGVGRYALAEDISDESIEQMIDTNLKGTIYCTLEVLADMKEKNSGIIANMISTAGKEGKVTESVYNASKFGVRGFTESLTRELEDTAVQVYAAYMGGMKTNFWDGIYTSEEMINLMDPDDVADIVIDNIKPRKNLSLTDVTIVNKIP